jgi:hypothetical protein
MKLPEDGPKCGLKHVAVIKQNQSKQSNWFILPAVLTVRIPQILIHNRIPTVDI